jgi:hypothetical protein
MGRLDDFLDSSLEGQYGVSWSHRSAGYEGASVDA